MDSQGKTPDYKVVFVPVVAETQTYTDEELDAAFSAGYVVDEVREVRTEAPEAPTTMVFILRLPTKPD